MSDRVGGERIVGRICDDELKLVGCGWSGLRYAENHCYRGSFLTVRRKGRETIDLRGMNGDGQYEDHDREDGYEQENLLRLSQMFHEPRPTRGGSDNGSQTTKTARNCRGLYEVAGFCLFCFVFPPFPQISTRGQVPPQKFKKIVL